ncbi:two-component system sensor histidine kinase DcuS [Sporosarcina sp. Marseille-Q4063]|uniref:DcuS/MalK family sensor histidine kinase n=1 Tax=Sporosarcina sp. Marseille-Q4063 TaxID=2810514 RepID=UPI001BB03808|nr:DcuS/MalK family sensor histidine kinase [Sporosarcina sp. Marseille-Q4063]QUW23107.1 two-component system sensor histidine kinase DcuS [Sporosarcina sp. Marseille-Q4063]
MINKNKIRLQTKLTILVCTVVLVSLLVTAYLIGSKAVENSRAFQENKVMDIATTISHTKLIKDGLTGNGPVEAIQSFTSEVQKNTSVQYIVVLNKNHIRQSHPVEERIGEYFVGGDEDRAYEGESYTSLAQGTLGESLRAFVPIYAENELVGVVSVGILSKNIQAAIFQTLRTSYIGIGIGLLIGVVGAFILARQVKRTLYGLEPEEIAKLLSERDAMLESVKEGIIAIDDKGEIVVANQAASQLFYQAGVMENPIGKQVEAYLPGSLLKQVVDTGEPSFNQEQKLNGIDIVVNRVPVILSGKIVGALATFRDKTELTSLVEQLSGAKAFAETLRTQTHEFMNKLHVITAMVHTKSYDELKEYTAYLSDVYQKEVGAVSRLIKDPVISGYLVNKLSKARETGIHVELTGEKPLPWLKKIEHMDKIITILGNLFDNAVEAVRDQKNAQIEITINYKDKHFYFDIGDNGPGISAADFEKTSQIGLSTKGENRGYGLYLVNKALTELGGKLQISSENRAGTQFHVMIPYEGETND